ncbi:HNH endonuclease [Microbacterium phage Quenya]|uniref:HNH endonuclease n=1 Tax=Microbacterium phage Quenya TaxID=2776868 RepID=UPI0018A6446E|nr:HNH endonuclease [Microbacterium phage Quenya]QOP64288.1 HNH endonuclease [Microbacterium phage Quenya]
MKKSVQGSVALTELAATRWGPKRKWRCIYCGRGAGLQVDHFVPEAMGGGSNVANLVPACDRCNQSKNGLEPQEWMDRVGVPQARQYALWRVIHLPEGVTLTVPDDRFELDYEAARALKAFRRPVQGAKGA